MGVILEVRSVDKLYAGDEEVVKVLNNINLKVNQGDFIAIMGASGSGKTTLLNLIATIDQNAIGEIKYKNHNLLNLKGRKLNKYRENEVAVVFQNHNLIDKLTVLENIELVKSINERVSQNYINELIDIFELRPHLDKYPNALSGGQKQRVGIVRALAKKPNILLCDEPTGSLDTARSDTLMKFLKEVNYRYDTTIIVVSHDVKVASYCSKTYFIKDGVNFTSCKRLSNMSDKMYYDAILNVLQVLF